MYKIIYFFKLPPTPWKEVLLSRPVWMNILAQWGNIWGLFTLMTQAPTYFKHIHGWDIKMVSNTISICLPTVNYKSVLASFKHLCGVSFLPGRLKVKADFGGVYSAISCRSVCQTLFKWR
jgi:hypothetical protein